MTLLTFVALIAGGSIVAGLLGALTGRYVAISLLVLVVLV